MARRREKPRSDLANKNAIALEKRAAEQRERDRQAALQRQEELRKRRERQRLER